MIANVIENRLKLVIANRLKLVIDQLFVRNNPKSSWVGTFLIARSILVMLNSKKEKSE